MKDTIINISCYFILTLVILWVLGRIFSEGVILFSLAINFIKDFFK